MEPNGIGKRIRFYRLQRGLTQMELADLVGVSYQQIQKYENEKSQITLRRLIVLAKVLDTSPTAILSAPTGSRLSEKPGRQQSARPREERTLLELYSKINSPQLKRTVLRLVRNIVEQQGRE
ncbi:MAG: helix-turn-helix transcriptional regulator [Spirochaetia bacterium]